MNTPILPLLVCYVASVTIAFGSTAIERNGYQLELPDGWHEGTAVRPVLDLGDNEPAAREKMFPQFIAETTDATCIISFAPALALTAGKAPAAVHAAAFRSSSSVIRESQLASIGGRDGVGWELVGRQPYPMISVLRVFSFEREGCICTLLITTSHEHQEEAMQRMSRHAEAIAEIVRSIEIKTGSVPE